MQDKPVVGMLLELGGDIVLDRAFDLVDILAGADAAAVSDAEDMGIDRLRGLMEPHVQHHIRGLAPDPGQRLQRGARRRHLAAIAVHQDLAQLDDVLRLVAEQPDGLDVVDQAVLAQGQHLLRCVGDRPEPARGLVHARIRRLRRQRHGNQQGVDIHMLQLAPGFGLGGLKPGKDLA